MGQGREREEEEEREDARRRKEIGKKEAENYKGMRKRKIQGEG